MKFLPTTCLLFFSSCTLFLSPRENRIRECYKFIETAKKKDYDKCRDLLQFGPVLNTKDRFIHDIDLISTVWDQNKIPLESEIIVKVDRDRKFTIITFPFRKYDSTQSGDTCKGYIEFSFDDYYWSNKIGSYFYSIPPCWTTVVQKLTKKNTIYDSLYDTRYIGRLKTISQMPYLIMSGRGYNKFNKNLAIYIRTLSDSQEGDLLQQAQYPYPGILYEMGTNRIISETRMFYGDCLTNKLNIVIWYQKTIDIQGQYINNVFTIGVNNDTLEKNILKPPIPDIKETLELLEQGKCKELKGIDQTTE